MAELPSKDTGNTLPANPLLGTNVGSAGVTGQSNEGPGVLGQSLGLDAIILPDKATTTGVPPSDGVLGIGKNGVHGQSAIAAGSGVLGENSDAGAGVSGTSTKGDGIFGSGAKNGIHGQSASATNSGVWGSNTGAGAGVSGSSVGGNGVEGSSASATNSGVWGNNTGAGAGVSGTSASGAGISGSSNSGNAGEFNGNVLVTGTLTVNQDVILTGADCAEQFDVQDGQAMEPGTVVVIDQTGALRESRDAYDKKVAGVVSGAGEYRPAIVLDRRESGRTRMPVALVGKVYCKVDAEYAPIEVGDLLAASPTAGHAMKVTDRNEAFGAVIGKALGRLDAGRGLIPMLIALQ
jgi:hypothetical protein